MLNLIINIHKALGLISILDTLLLNKEIYGAGRITSRSYEKFIREVRSAPPTGGLISLIS